MVKKIEISNNRYQRLSLSSLIYVLRTFSIFDHLSMSSPPGDPSRGYVEMTDSIDTIGDQSYQVNTLDREFRRG